MQLDGFKELETALQQLGPRYARPALRGAMRDAARPIVRRAKANAPRKSGKLKKSIKSKVYIGKGQQLSIASVLIGSFGRASTDNDAFYAHMVEKGTEGHSLQPKSRRETKKKSGSAGNATGRNKGRQHPGAKAKPFLKPAVFSEQKKAFKILGNRLAERIIVQQYKKNVKGG